MAKRIILTELLRLPVPGSDGASRPFRLPVLDGDGNVIFEEPGCPQCGRPTKPKMADADLVDILQRLIFQIPRQLLTTQDTIHMHRLYGQLMDGRKNGAKGVLSLEDAEYDWALKMLQRDEIGPKLYGHELPTLFEAIQNVEKAHQPKAT